MKKLIAWLLVGIVSIGMLAACSSSKLGQGDAQEPLQVELSTVQHPLRSKQAAIIEAHVTQCSQKVTGAHDHEVKFEIWKQDHDKHETIVADHGQDGVYRIKKLFPEDGAYHVIVHVDNQVLPQKDLLVGNVASEG